MRTALTAKTAAHTELGNSLTTNIDPRDASAPTHTPAAHSTATKKQRRAPRPLIPPRRRASLDARANCPFSALKHVFRKHEIRDEISPQELKKKLREKRSEWTLRKYKKPVKKDPGQTLYVQEGPLKSINYY